MNIAILGANGRMGRELLLAVTNDADVTLGAACVREFSPLIGQPVSSLVQVNNVSTILSDFSEHTLTDSSVVIDFTLPDTLEGHLSLCEQTKTPIVIGTTGLDDKQKSLIEASSKHIPIVFAANYSVGVTLMTRLCQIAASCLEKSADIEIIEAHHRFKRDAPSGTAMAIGEAIAKQIGRSIDTDAIYGREGDTGEREHKTIGFSTIRGGDIIGEHTVLFADIGERLEITHKASSRQTFALGALRAAKWIVGQPAGLYGMDHVLNLEDVLSF